MDVTEAIRFRNSIRGYKPDPVPKKVLREILEIASRSPSANNVQPWDITVVTGEPLDNIRQGHIELLTSGTPPNPDFPMKRFEGVYRQRQVDLAIQIFQLMGIARENRSKRAEWEQRGLRFVDAPAAMILSVDESLSDSDILLNIGLITQTICLAALNYGLGTCIENAGGIYPGVLRTFAGIPESKRIVTSIAIGYPDWNFPANKLESKREPVENIATWCGFD